MPVFGVLLLPVSHRHFEGSTARRRQRAFWDIPSWRRSMLPVPAQ
jgi:hypothetical protein